MQNQSSPTIVFPSAQDAAECASRQTKNWPKSRAAIRQIDGRSCNVVLLVGERQLTRGEV